jgi:uncharacterized protein involved in exopolysaccharide biosynthesis
MDDINRMDDKMNKSEVPNEPSEAPNVPSEVPKVPKVPSEAASRNPDLLPEIVRAVVNEFIGVVQHTPQPPVIGFTWGDFVEVLKKRRLYLLIGAIVGAQLAVLTLVFTTPLYGVSAQVVITQQAPGQLIDTDAGSSAFIATQAEVINSLTVVQAAVAMLPRPAHLDPEDDAVADALNAVNASAISGTRVIALAYLGADAKYGADLLTAMVDVYLTEARSTTRSGQATLLDTKGGELEKLLEEIARQESHINELRRVTGITGTADEAVAAQTERLNSNVAELMEARNRRIEAESRLATGGATSIVDDPRSSLREELRQAKSELAIASIMLTAEHPTVVGAKRNVAVLEAQLASTVDGSRGALRQQVDAATRREAELTTIEAQSRQRLEAIELHRREENKLLVELARLQLQADEWGRDVSDQRLVAQLAQAGDVGIGARIIAKPVVPDEPVWPKKKFVLLAGTVLGLTVGFVFALISLRRRRDPGVVNW